MPPAPRTRRPALAAHRGHSAVAPENTLPAFRAALALGVEYVELDYRHSADGVPFVFHDDTLARKTNASESACGCSWAPEAYPWHELRELDAGRWFAPEFAGTRIPSLDEALAVILPGATPLVERKSGDAGTLIRLLAARGATEHVVVFAFDTPFLFECRRLAPTLPLAYLGEGDLPAARVDEARRLGALAVAWNQRDLTAEAIARVHAAGLEAWSWTVNDPERARTLVEWGLDVLISDDPPRVAASTSR